MLILKWQTQRPATDAGSLTYAQRCQTELQFTLQAADRPASLTQARDHIVAIGSHWMGSDGHTIVEIKAAPEHLLEVHIDRADTLIQLAYKCGIQRIPTEIVIDASGIVLRFLRLPIFVAWLQQEGCSPHEVMGIFNPQDGGKMPQA